MQCSINLYTNCTALRLSSDLVPEHDSWWALMWTHLNTKYPRQNSGTVLVPESRPCTLALNCSWVFGVHPVWTWHYFVPVLRHQCSGTKCEHSRRLRSDLAPEHGARERFLMGTNVNTPKLQAPTPEFGRGARARVQGLYFVLGHYMVLGALESPVSEHNTIFFSVLRQQCSGTKCKHSWSFLSEATSSWDTAAWDT